MMLHLFWYECKNCGDIFKSPALTGDGYGEFLMRNKKGDIAYFNSFNDKVFDDIKSIFKKIAPPDQSNNAELFQNILGVACDLSQDKSAYSVNQKTPCPKCGEVNIGHWGPTNPAEIIDMEIPHVTHEHWNKLSDTEKKFQINEAVEKFLADKDNKKIF